MPTLLLVPCLLLAQATPLQERCTCTVAQGKHKPATAQGLVELKDRTLHIGFKPSLQVPGYQELSGVPKMTISNPKIGEVHYGLEKLEALELAPDRKSFSFRSGTFAWRIQSPKAEVFVQRIRAELAARR